MDVEKLMRETDFSQLSKVRSNLKQKLLSNRTDELNIDELDMVTAAIATIRKPTPRKDNEKFLF